MKLIRLCKCRVCTALFLRHPFNKDLQELQVCGKTCKRLAELTDKADAHLEFLGEFLK
jgi:hypothetical protein